MFYYLYILILLTLHLRIAIGMLMVLKVEAILPLIALNINKYLSSIWKNYNIKLLT